MDYLSAPFSSAPVSPFQLVERMTSHRVEKSLSKLFNFLIPSATLPMLFAAGYLLYWVFLVLFKHLRKRRPNRSSRRSPQVKILLIFFLAFRFFNAQFLGGNLNTSNVIVDTRDLLYSKDQIVRTDKE